MSESEELFPMTPSERMQTLRTYLVAESGKAEEALERAEERVRQAHGRLYLVNESIEALVAAEKAAKGIISYEVDTSTGEVQT